MESWANTASCPAQLSPGRCDFYCYGKTVPLWKELLSCKILAIPAVAAAGTIILLNKYG